MEAIQSARSYKTPFILERNLRIAYPAGKGRVMLRTEQDWNKNIEAVEVSEDGNLSTFHLEAHQPFLYFKPVLVDDHGVTTSSPGPNKMLLMQDENQRIVYPSFFSPDRGRFSELIEFPSNILGRMHKLRVYLPPGYDENILSTYSVAFMQDGQNLFFPEEAFQGHTWIVDDTRRALRSMSAVEEFVIVGIHSADRVKEYTSPGYSEYARSLVEEIVPKVESALRVGRHRRYRSVWGASLGGVVAFYTVWQHPDVFGVGVCMSTPFGNKDDLIGHVLSEPERDVAFYLDSGWPEDNYEATTAMAMALVSRGWKYGLNLFHLCFPLAGHDESAWGMRLHLPLQFINGGVVRAAHIGAQVLGDYP